MRDELTVSDPLVLDISTRLGTPLETRKHLIWAVHIAGYELAFYLPRARGAQTARIELIRGGLPSRRWAVPIHDPENAPSLLRRFDAAIDEVRDDERDEPLRQ